MGHLQNLYNEWTIENVKINVLFSAYSACINIVQCLCHSNQPLYTHLALQHCFE